MYIYVCSFLVNDTRRNATHTIPDPGLHTERDAFCFACAGRCWIWGRCTGAVFFSLSRSSFVYISWVANACDALLLAATSPAASPCAK